jgi:hypothetical protein
LPVLIRHDFLVGANLNLVGENSPGISLFVFTAVSMSRRILAIDQHPFICKTCGTFAAKEKARTSGFSLPFLRRSFDAEHLENVEDVDSAAPLAIVDQVLPCGEALHTGSDVARRLTNIRMLSEQPERSVIPSTTRSAISRLARLAQYIRVRSAFSETR